MTHAFRCVATVLCLTGALTACGPEESGLSSLEVPPQTLTAIATRDFEASATPRPPTRTPAPTLPPTATPVPSATPTQAPVAIAPDAARISRFGSGTAPRLATLLMLDGRAGWAISAPILDGDDHLLTTADSGFTWREATPPQPVTSAWLRGSGLVMTALNASTAWATFFDRAQSSASGVAWVWRTLDGGASWETSVALPIADRPGYLPIEISFSDQASGWLVAAVGGGGDRGNVVILSTTDGGQAWQALAEFAPDVTGCQYTGIRRVSAARGFLFASCRGSMADSPILRETDDGGMTWTQVTLVRPDGFPASFPGTCTAQATYAGSDGLALTVDCRNAETGAAVQYLYSDDNDLGELAPVLIDGRLEGQGFYSNGEGVLLVDTEPALDGPLTVVAVADGGSLLTPRRRVTWRGPLTVVSAAEAWALYSGGASGRFGFLRTTDGGATWGDIDPVVR